MKITEAYIKKLIENKLTPSQYKEFLQAIDTNPEVINDYFSEAEWNSYVEGKESISTITDFEIVKQKINPINTKSIYLFNYKFLAAATIIVILCTSIYFNYFHKVSSKFSQTAKIEIQNELTNLKNESDSAKIFILPDSSTVSLYPSSEIYYQTKNYNKNSRSINLKGKAYFEVKKNKKLPFIVEANNTFTTAIGTSFSISTSAEITKIILYTGKVSVRDNYKILPANLILSPNNELIINATTQSYAKNNLPVNDTQRGITPKLNNTNTFTKKYKVENQFVFDNESVIEIINNMKIQYNISIETNNLNLNGVSFSGRFSSNQSFYDILSEICLSNGYQLTKQSQKAYSIQK